MAARAAARILQFTALVAQNQLPLEFADKKPLCMAQYARIFGTCRIPIKNCDQLVSFESAARQMLFAYRGNFFVLTVYHADGTPYNAAEIFTALQEMMTIQHTYTRYPSIGLLTSEERDVWANHYATLRLHPQNVDSLGLSFFFYLFFL